MNLSGLVSEPHSFAPLFRVSLFYFKLGFLPIPIGIGVFEPNLILSAVSFWLILNLICFQGLLNQTVITIALVMFISGLFMFFEFNY